MNKKKKQKDRLFILVTAVVLGNLAYHLWNTLSWLITNPSSLFLWSLVVANAVAVIGLLWLMRDYVRRRQVEKEAERKLASEITQVPDKSI